jgi:hypothetical protein
MNALLARRYPPLAWLLAGFLVLGLWQLCLFPVLDAAGSAVARRLAPPTPTPVALALVADPADERAARDAFRSWLVTHHEMPISTDPELDDRAYYLAGEAPRLRRSQTWPEWYGLRYTVGPVGGQWLTYWPGGSACFASAYGASLATWRYPDLGAAARVGVAAAWREEHLILAVVWPGLCPTPQPLPTSSSWDGPTGPGW